MPALTPPPLPYDDNLLVQLVITVARGLGRALVYWWRRLRTAPGMGVLYAVVIPASLWIMATHIGAFFPAGLGGKHGGRAGLTLTPEMVRSGALLLAITVLLILVMGLDQRVKRRALQRAATKATALPAVDPDLVLLGHRYRRVWNKTRPAWEHRRSTESFSLSEKELRASIGICAPTGQGKSRGFLDEILAWGERTSSNVMWVDPKGDDAAPARFTHVFDLLHLDQSFKWDLYGDLSPVRAAEALGEAIFTNLPGVDPAAEYFSDNAKEALRAIFVAHAAADTLTLPTGRQLPGRNPTPREVFDYAADPQSLQALAELLPEGSPARIDLARVLTLVNSESDALGQIFNKLGPLARSAVANYLVSGGAGLSIRELVNRPAVRVLWALNTGEYRRVSAILGRLVVSLWTYAIIAPVRQDYLKLLLCDEAATFAAGNPDLPQGMVMCRSHNAGYVLAVQHLNQLGANRAAWDSCGTKIVTGGVPNESAEEISREIGEREYLFTGTTTSQNVGRGGGNTTGAELIPGSGPGAGSSRQRSSGVSQGESEQVHLRRTWLPTELQNLPPFHAVVVVTNRYQEDPHDPVGGGRDIALIRFDNQEPGLAGQRRGQAAQAYALQVRFKAQAVAPPVTVRDVDKMRGTRADLQKLMAHYRVVARMDNAARSPQQQAEWEAVYAQLQAATTWYRYYAGEDSLPGTALDSVAQAAIQRWQEGRVQAKAAGAGAAQPRKPKVSRADRGADENRAADPPRRPGRTKLTTQWQDRQDNESGRDAAHVPGSGRSRRRLVGSPAETPEPGEARPELEQREPARAVRVRRPLPTPGSG